MDGSVVPVRRVAHPTRRKRAWSLLAKIGHLGAVLMKPVRFGARITGRGRYNAYLQIISVVHLAHTTTDGATAVAQPADAQQFQMLTHDINELNSGFPNGGHGLPRGT